MDGIGNKGSHSFRSAMFRSGSMLSEIARWAQARPENSTGDIALLKECDTSIPAITINIPLLPEWNQLQAQRTKDKAQSTNGTFAPNLPSTLTCEVFDDCKILLCGSPLEKHARRSHSSHGSPSQQPQEYLVLHPYKPDDGRNGRQWFR